MTIEQKTAKTTLNIIRDNTMKFKLSTEFKNTINKLAKQDSSFTENQLSFIDGLYEKYMKAGGFESVGVKHDFKRK
jgi:hypothetical protein